MATKRKPSKPNPQAVAAVTDRFLWWLTKREMERRAKMLKGRKRAASINI
jgi:hypothetical protein